MEWLPLAFAREVPVTGHPNVWTLSFRKITLD